MKEEERTRKEKKKNEERERRESCWREREGKSLILLVLSIGK
jgi:hypothetical protein